MKHLKKQKTAEQIGPQHKVPKGLKENLGGKRKTRKIKQKGGFNDVVRACLARKTSLLDQDRLTPERINERDSDGKTPLMEASICSEPTIALLLLENGADVNAANKDGKTALMMAAQYSPRMVRLLLDNGADVNAKTREGFTALMFAAERKQRYVVEILIQSGADPNIKNNYGRTVIDIIRSTTPIDQTDEKNRNNIIHLIRMNPIIKKSIERQKDKMHFGEIMDNFDGLPSDVKHEMMTKYVGGQTKTKKSKKSKKNNKTRSKKQKGKISSDEEKLLEAAGDGDLDNVKIALSNGADVNVKGGYNKTTPIINASMYGEPEVVSILLENGADVNAKDNHGETALMMAARYGNTDIVSTLVKKGADVNAKDNFGDTVLMHSLLSNSTSSNLDAIRILLQNGADATVKDAYGVSTVKLASGGPAEEILKHHIDMEKIIKKTVERQKDRQHFAEKMEEHNMPNVLKNDMMTKYLGGKKQKG